MASERNDGGDDDDEIKERRDSSHLAHLRYRGVFKTGEGAHHAILQVCKFARFYNKRRRNEQR